MLIALIITSVIAVTALVVAVVAFYIAYTCGKAFLSLNKIVKDFLECYDEHTKSYNNFVRKFNESNQLIKTAFEGTYTALKVLDEKVACGMLSEETLRRALDLVDEEQARVDAINVTNTKKTEGVN